LGGEFYAEIGDRRLGWGERAFENDKTSFDSIGYDFVVLHLNKINQPNETILRDFRDI